jgi:phage terminase large subunit
VGLVLGLVLSRGRALLGPRLSLDHKSTLFEAPLTVLKINPEFPEKLSFLFQPKRYKVAYGGRGGAKSWGIARALLVLCLQKKLRVLCARELQNSIGESVHKLLSSQIERLGLSKLFTVLNTEIRCNATGSEFQFAGIRNNPDKIKSYEDFDICWVEEANRVTKVSWNILIPTIRKTGSEIWLSFNPELEEDYTYQEFVVRQKPDSEVVFMSYRDNPWFSSVLQAEMETMKESDYETYLWVWEGQCRRQLEGAVYGKELAQIELDGRLTKVPYDPRFPVDVFCDLGRADMTSLWFRQFVGLEFHYIKYYEDNLHSWDHYLQYLQLQGYTYGTIWLPHDAKAKVLSSKMSIQEQTIAKGFKVRLVPKLSVADGINAARTVLPLCYFDQEACAAGLICLRRYHYEKVESAVQIPGRPIALSERPVHDEFSHGADSFRYAAVSSKAPQSYSTEHLHPVSAGILNRAKRIAGKATSGARGWMRH